MFYDVTVKHLDCAGEETETTIITEANGHGHAARKAFKSLIQMKYIKNQPLSSRDGGWEGVKIFARSRFIVKFKRAPGTTNYRLLPGQCIPAGTVVRGVRKRETTKVA